MLSFCPGTGKGRKDLLEIKGHGDRPASAAFQGVNPVLNTFPELFVRHGRITNGQPGLTGDQAAGSAVREAVLTVTAGIDRAGFPVCVKYFSAGLVTSGARIKVKRTGGTVDSADRQSQDLPLLPLRETLQNQFVGTVQPMLQHIIRDLPISFDGIPVLFVTVVSGNVQWIHINFKFKFTHR